MNRLSELLATYGHDVLQQHTTALIALVQPDGELIEWNQSLGRLKQHLPTSRTLGQMLVPSSEQRLRHMLKDVGLGQPLAQGALHFVAGETDLPLSYDCTLLAIPAGQILFYADPIPLLDERAAREYFQIMNELAATVRELHKARHELLTKQQALEEALARIEEIAQTDELTRLPNRRCILNYLEDQITQANRYHSDLSVFIIDIDHFKHVNDVYGHQMGDYVLQHLARQNLRSLRKVDLIGRYGGEEFLAILPAINAATAAQAANRLRRQVEATSFAVEGGQALQLTISIGVAQFCPACDTLQSLLAHADSALYAAKASGRNRVCTWDAPRHAVEQRVCT